MKKVILFLLFLTVAITGSMAGTVFEVDNAGDGDDFQNYNAGTNTLRKCIRLANNTANGGTPHQIVFKLPALTVITVNSDLPTINNNGNAGGLIIDATIAPMAGYGGAPLIGIFRGNGQNGNGFNIDGANNVTIRGLAIQNFVVGIRVNNSTGSTLDKNFIGTNLAGTSIAGTTIKTNGIFLDANASNTNITSNVISGCMSVGDGNFYGAINIRPGSHGVKITSNFIGTDATGSNLLGNGTNQPYRQQGIYIDGSSTVANPIVISGNVISGNVGNGIWATNTAGLKIVGNHIGTDIGGTKAIGNKAAGIRVDRSNNVTIGGSTVADRNIISGNGGAIDSRPCGPDYCGEPCNFNACPTGYDATLQTGIYFSEVTSSKISGNYVGTNETGTSTGTSNSLGNFYAGIKLETSSSNVTIGGNTAAEGNVIGGNGFGIYPNNGKGYRGHGIQLNGGSVSNIFVYNNRVGVGPNNEEIGNRQDGISLLGAHDCKIGDAASIADPAGKGNIVGNNSWGIFLQSDFSNNDNSNQARNNSIKGNYLGNDGSVALGNGTRALDDEGAGIGIQHGSNNNVVEFNVISGNRDGVTFRGQGFGAGVANNSETTSNIIRSNYIGTDKTGKTAMANRNNGILVTEGAQYITIGGTVAGQGNIIAGNTTDGIHMEDGDRVKIFNNKIGVEKDGLALANGGDGIELKQSTGTSGGSTNNIIGGVNAGESNTIANNGGNGVVVDGATSINNSIHHNSFSCNALRGIVLSNGGNNNYAKPTFSGTPTNFKVTGPTTTSYIEIYEIDECHNCGLDPDKVQGKTLVQSGLSPQAFVPAAGKTNKDYTAIVSVNGTTAAHNTSEFTSCIALCVEPKPDITGSAYAFCDNTQNVTFSTPNVSGNTYSWTVTDGLTIVGSSTGNSITINVGATGGTLSVKELAGACEGIHSRVITVNQRPETPGIVGNISPCENSTGVKYSIPSTAGTTYTWTVPTGVTLVSGQGTNEITVNIGAAATTSGKITVTAKTSSTTCEDLTPSEITLDVKPRPETPGIVGNATPCENTPGLKYSVPATAGTTYTWTVPTGVTIVSGQGTNEITVNIGSATAASGDITVTAKTNSTTCEDLSPSKITLDVKPRPETPGIVGNDAPCENTPGLKYSVTATAGTTYTWTVPAGVTIVTGQGTNEITVNIGSAATASGEITVTAKTTSTTCEDLSPSKITLDVKPRPETPGIVGNSTPCENTPGLKYSVPSTAGTTYTWNVPGGVTIVTGQGTNEITVNIGSAATASGEITVTAKTTSTTCEDLSPSKITLDVKPRPETPGIVGNSTPCENTPGLKYSVPSTAGTTYIWNVPAGVTIVSGQGTNEITVNIGSASTASGDITVAAKTTSTTCEDLSPSKFTLDVKPRPETPGIVGEANPCENSPGLKYSVPSTAGTTYTWVVPTGVTIISGQGTNEITVDIGTSATASGDITVFATTTSTTCEDLSPSKITLNVNPRPETPGIVGNDAPCENTPGLKYSVTATAGLTYNWNVPAGVTIVSGQGTNEITVNIGPEATASGDITVYASTGSSATACSDLSPSTITLDVQPRPETPTVDGDDEVCENSSGHIYTIPSETGVEYKWTVPAGFTITAGDNTNSITVSVAEGASDGIIKVYLINSTTKCEDLSPSEFAVKVNPRPVTPGITGSAEVCEDTKDHIYSVPAVSGVDYKWSVPAGFTITSGDNTNSITVSVAAGAADGVIKVYLVNQQSNCEDLTPSEVNIKVNTLPVLTLTPDANEICEGSSTVLKTFVTGGNGAVTYNWTATPGPNPSGESPTVSPADTTIYTLIVTDTKGCSADTQSVQIDVNENPVLVISTTVNDTICKGTSAILSTNITKGNKPYVSLVWTASPAPVPNQDDFNPTVSPTVTTDYTATVTDSKNCKATDAIKITVIDVPEGPLSASVDRSVICNTDTRNIELSATLGTDPKVIPIWYKNGCGLDSVTSGNPAPVAPPDTTTTYYIALKNVCGISECKSVNVKVNKDPKDDLIDAIVSDTSICSAYAGVIELSVDTIYNPDAVINWYMKDKDLKDSLIGHGTPYALPKNPKDTTYYYVNLFVEACLPSPTDSVPVNVIDPKVDAGGVKGDEYIYCKNNDLALVMGRVKPINVDWKWIPENSNAPLLFDTTRLVSNVNTKSPAEKQKWYLIADNGICKPVVDSMYLTVHDLPVVTLDIPQDTLCSKVEFDATATVVKGVPNAYVWLTPNSSIPDTSYVTVDHTNPLTKRFTAEVVGRNYFLVTVVDTNNCWAELPAIDSVEIFDHQELVIPNLMTPNHDGKNETYIIRDVNNYDILPGAKLEVYNRWGERVYKNSSYDNSWNAANISDGMYYYYLKTGCAKDEYKGWLHIISNNNRSE
ncbi:MAG: gliding motility-associated C-terminal domain-containing protein [Sporocytophaga sp.]|uniref:T9SS type B sorting domain-containing protein n=1 Tax=Sporocytophaga sp. TaxID=2231183 RepID=UPI001B1F15AB|nr:gliding motility-associated C-terminal domain-containing protein [Sporocytophaga sp.]MBO9701663.1 gliding motility-associated C-terminal domain-containing protein [Sporocytophaga sp.]